MSNKQKIWNKKLKRKKKLAARLKRAKIMAARLSQSDKLYNDFQKEQRYIKPDNIQQMDNEDSVLKGFDVDSWKIDEQEIKIEPVIETCFDTTAWNSQ